ncbi:helix-turn-helix domain-containing protein [Nocardia sp. NPDC058666]|uniref:helix-turn-helix domain-containing protein n=1 Tax=Nocardia sp. NPDC058666 TaxID=3346587 RepID=UPI00364AA0AD
MTTWFRRTPEAETLFAEERLLLSATEMVHAALDEKGVSKKKLAEMLDVTPTEVSQRLSGRRNLTLRSLARMMHVLGYRVRLDADPVGGDIGPDVVGTRITRHVLDRGDAPEKVWSVCFRAAISADGIKDPADFAAHISELWSNLQTLDHISSARLDHRDGQIMVETHVRADDLLQACTRGTAAVRTAIHSAGGGTPGWEKEMERLVRQLRLDVSSDSDCLGETGGHG